MRSSASKLMDIIEDRSGDMARSWYFNVIKNPRTPSFHDIFDDDLVPPLKEFYGQFRTIFANNGDNSAAVRYFRQFGDYCYRKGIPVDQALYAVTLMRRHIWLDSDYQIAFATSVDQAQAVETQNRAIRLFDHGLHLIPVIYKDHTKEDVDKDMKELQVIMMRGSLEKFKSSIMALILFVAGMTILFYHVFLKANIQHTHLFFIPIALAALWWQKKGVAIAVGLGAFLVSSNYAFLAGASWKRDLVTAIMFVLIAFIIGALTEAIGKIQTAYKA
ncbi:MAG TPA: hypothetical protein P5551_00720 [Syntrophales bacterium]|nr:hypothetical protein [Syntrophales bacterium]